MRHPPAPGQPRADRAGAAGTGRARPRPGTPHGGARALRTGHPRQEGLCAAGPTRRARSLPSSLTHTRPATLRSPPGAAVSRNRAPPLLRAQGERRGCGAGGGGPPAPAPAPSPAGRGRARARLGLVVPSAAPPGAHPPQPTSPSMPRGRRALPLGGAVAAVTSAVRPGGPWAGWSSLVN